MQQTEETTKGMAAERERLGPMTGTLAQLGAPQENVAEVAHDARNMVTALGLYCDLLQEPGVLAEPFLHYAHELQLVTAASRRLMEKLATMDAHLTAQPAADDPAQIVDTLLRGHNAHLPARPAAGTELTPAQPIGDMAAQMFALRNLLGAMAGPSIGLTMTASGGRRAVYLTGEDLTRILVNLVKNAAEATPNGGHIHIHLNETPDEPEGEKWLTLTVEDNGNGIAAAALEHLFEAGYSTRAFARHGQPHRGRRGLGLSITRSIVEAAGGRIHAANRDPSGACIQIELPARSE